nr:bifunctional precorrin-2 dehydrogenase/sirohydrochlorin ferrochelatase [Paenibacillus shirakamiensis]
MLKGNTVTAIVIGGGVVAERKVKSLLKAGAAVRVVSPKLTAWLTEQWTRERITCLLRPYQAGDVRDAHLVYAATDQVSINAKIVDEANRAHIPVNRADQGDMGTFLSPSVLSRGNLVIAVSTLGAGPLAAVQITKELQHQYGPEYEHYLDILSLIRSTVKQHEPDIQKRRKLLQAALNMDLMQYVRSEQFKMWDESDVLRWMKHNNDGRTYIKEID